MSSSLEGDDRSPTEAGDGYDLGDGNAADSLAQLQGELLQAQQDVLRAQAELENFRKRIRRDYEDQLKYAALPLLRDMIPVIDNLQRALHAASTHRDDSGLQAGVRLVAQQLQEILSRHHCRSIEAVGQPFDPNYHEAIGQTPHADVPASVICVEALRGYQLHDRVIRPSQVIISSGPPEAT